MTNGPVLTAYFSHSGNTRAIAEQIHRTAEGTLFEIAAMKPYPADYNAVVEQARVELDWDFRPALTQHIRDMDRYPTVVVCYPNWWGTIPRPVATFLSAYDFAGRIVAPVCTHGGGGPGRSFAEIRDLCPRSTVPDGLAIPGGSVNRAGDTLAAWLFEIGITGKP